MKDNHLTRTRLKRSGLLILVAILTITINYLIIEVSIWFSLLALLVVPFCYWLGTKW